MANLLPNTTTDFNLTNKFGEGDLDIGWAHLQVMKLWELSSDDTITIAGTSFNLKDTSALRNAIQKIYDVNIAGGIAADSLGDVYNPPEMFTSETYVKVWRLNDVFAPGKFGKQPDIRQPTSLYESVGGEMAGTITGSGWFWARKGKNDGYLKLASSGGCTISLDDKKEVSGNAFPYCISFSMYISALGDGVLFRKGEFYMELKNNKILLKRNNFSKVISFKLPNSQDATDLKNKWTEVRFIGAKVPNLQTGAANAEFQVFIDNKECELVSAQYSNTIRSADENEPFVFSCNPIESLKNVRISKATLTFPEYAEDFQYDISLDKVSSFNYQKFENELIDNAGNFLGVTGFPGVNNQIKTWVAKDGSGGPSASHVAKVGANRYITASDVDISKNFTISFWFKGISTTNNVVLFDSVHGSKYFRAYFASGDLKIQLPNKTYTVSSSVSYTSWTHCVIVKSGEGLGVYLNGTLEFSADITNKTGTVTLMDLNFGASAKDKEAYHLSSLKIMKYAITHIGVSGWDNVNTDDKVARLMNNNF